MRDAFRPDRLLGEAAPESPLQGRTPCVCRSACKRSTSGIHVRGRRCVSSVAQHLPSYRGEWPRAWHGFGNHALAAPTRDLQIKNLASRAPVLGVPSKREVWSLLKGEHTARAIVTTMSHGQELSLYVNGWLVGSQRFRDPDRALDDVAIEHCESFEARGWTAPT